MHPVGSLDNPVRPELWLAHAHVHRTDNPSMESSPGLLTTEITSLSLSPTHTLVPHSLAEKAQAGLTALQPTASA